MPRPATVAFGELQPSLVADPALADEGEKRVAWARAHMPVLARLRAEMERDRPLEGRRIGMCLHVEAKTAVLVETLLAGGAEIAWTGSPATTDDGVAAAMTTRDNLRIYAAQGRRHRRPTTRTSGASSHPTRTCCSTTAPTSSRGPWTTRASRVFAAHRGDDLGPPAPHRGAGRAASRSRSS